MAQSTATMSELRLEVLLEAEQSGESVAEFRRRYKVSRETYYRYRRRYWRRGSQRATSRIRSSPWRRTIRLLTHRVRSGSRKMLFVRSSSKVLMA